MLHQLLSLLVGQESDPEGIRVEKSRVGSLESSSLHLNPGSTIYSCVTLGKLPNIPVLCLWFFNFQMRLTLIVFTTQDGFED